MHTSGLDAWISVCKTTQLPNPALFAKAAFAVMPKPYTVLLRFFQITYTIAVSIAAIPLRSIHIGFSCRLETAGRVAAACVSGLVESTGAVALIVDEALAAWVGAAKPIPEISNA